MEPTQPSTTPTYAATPGIFGTKIPASVAFAIGVLLFLLPFAEIKCNNTAYLNNTGIGIAMGNDWKQAGGGLFGNNGLGGDKKSEALDKTKKQDINIYAIAGLALGLLGLGLSFANAKPAAGGALVTGILSAGALIGMMLDIKKWFNDSLAKDAANKTHENPDLFGINKIGDTFNNMKPTLAFTPWFYVAVVAFLAAAFFSYRRMGSMKT